MSFVPLLETLRSVLIGSRHTKLHKYDLLVLSEVAGNQHTFVKGYMHDESLARLRGAGLIHSDKITKNGKQVLASSGLV